MRGITFIITCFFLVFPLKGDGTAKTGISGYYLEKASPGPSDLVFDYLTKTMDTFHTAFDVFTDLGAAGNHFPVRAVIPDENAAITMDECCTENPLSGSTCIKCTFRSQGNNYGGVYFLNGMLKGNETEASVNWGDEPNAGFNLSGATKITFYARGKTGGEKVEFFVGGVGWAVDWQGDSTVPEKPYPDSFPKIRTGIITLTRDWKQYSLNVQNQSLRYVLSGFGWVASSDYNNNITFYIDHIQWNKSHLKDLRLLVSYETNPTLEDFDVLMKNVAFSYDNTLALLAFLANGSRDDLDRAALLADGFVHAIKNDRFYTNPWLRNGYMGGDLKLFPGWKPHNRKDTARMPGFWDCGDQKWYEDNFQISTHTGNVAWIIIALLSSHQVLGNDSYLQAAQDLAEWVESNCRDSRGKGGYTGGYEGWEPTPKKLLYKSTEHNLDLYVAFYRLYEITSAEKWLQRALHAETFIKSMWDETGGKFYTGTDNTGVTTNQEVIPLDVQSWSILVFRNDPHLYSRALTYAEAHHRVGDGFDFNTDKDGIWYEGTAQMALAYQAVGETGKAEMALDTIEAAQFESGAIPAASKNGLTTGFNLSDGDPWLYYRRGHVGASAWYGLAKLKMNPYWIGSGDNLPPEISVNRERLNFGYIIGGPIPGAQDVAVSNTGEGILHWQITADQEWLKYDPGSGVNTGIATITVDPTGLVPGSYTGSLTVTDPNAANSPQAITINLIVKMAADNESPFGSFETPLDGSTVFSSIPVTGWVLDDTGIENLKIYLKQGDNLVYIGDAFLVDGARPDVAAAYPGYPEPNKAGWGYMMLTNFLPNGGNGTFVLQAIATDGMGIASLLGTKTIYVDNQNAVKPFGAIDTPFQGGTAAGSSFINWGWALTPQPNSIPTDGSTLTVFVDGINMGHPIYNVFRSDIAFLFPSYDNSSGAAGYFNLDTTAFDNGVHTIQWLVTDNAGNTDGIGSRYFTIFNGSSSSSTSKSKTKTNRFSGHLKEFPKIPFDFLTYVRVKKGSCIGCKPNDVYPDEKGIIRIEIEELENLEVQFSQIEKAAGERTASLPVNISHLPIGSKFDRGRGVFYWQPGPGFVGLYRFLVTGGSSNRESVNYYLYITIVPKGSKRRTAPYS